MHDSIPARRRRRAAYQHSRVGEWASGRVGEWASGRVGEAILSTAEDV